MGLQKYRLKNITHRAHTSLAKAAHYTHIAWMHDLESQHVNVNVHVYVYTMISQ